MGSETYQNEELNFQLQYPSRSWQVNKEAEDSIEFISKDLDLGQAIFIERAEYENYLFNEQEALEILSTHSAHWYDSSLWHEDMRIDIVMEPTVTTEDDKIVAKIIAKSTLVLTFMPPYEDGTMPEKDFYQEIRVILGRNDLALIGINYGTVPPPKSAKEIDRILDSFQFID